MPNTYGFHRYQRYSREQVAALLAPSYGFTKGAGTWGLQGKIPFGDGLNFAFFVTIGQQQGEHLFDESIDRAGILRWQSQPQQGLADRDVRAWIRHDPTRHDILLFLKPRRGLREYMFMGSLKYIAHDSQRQNPVHFQWKILDFNPDTPELAQFGIVLVPASNEGEGGEVSSPPAAAQISGPIPLVKRSRPPAAVRGIGVTTQQFRQIAIDYEERDRRNRGLGTAGEKLVLEHERERLRARGRVDLAAKVDHVAITLRDTAGYDIRSYDPDTGAELHIEVKTTTGPASTPFYMSEGERLFAVEHPSSYKIYRLYGFKPGAGSLEYFEVSGLELLTLQPISYRVLLA